MVATINSKIHRKELHRHINIMHEDYKDINWGIDVQNSIDLGISYYQSLYYHLGWGLFEGGY